MVGTWGTVIRFVISALVLLLVGHIVPGFAIFNIWQALLAAVVIAALGYLVEALMGERSQHLRGIVGFLVSVLIIYLAALVVPGIHITILGAFLAALVIGLIDTFVPTVLR